MEFMRKYESAPSVILKRTILAALMAIIVSNSIQTTNAAEAIEEIIVFGTQSRLDS